MSSLRNSYYNVTYGKTSSPKKEISRRPFVNELYGNNMAQDPAFSGIPVLINNGGDSVGWTPTIVQGVWDFTNTTNPYAGTQCIQLTSGSNGDTVNFSTGSPIDGTLYNSVDMHVRLETWSSTNNTISLQFKNGGTPVGDLINLADYITVTSLNIYQHAIITLGQVGLGSQTFDEVDVIVTRSGGPAPILRFDNFNVQELGGTLIYTANPKTTPIPEIMRLQKIRFTIVSPNTGNSTLNYNDLLGETLANGLLINRVENNEIIIGRNIMSRSDFYSFDFNEITSVDDGVNYTWVIEVSFQEQLILRGELGDQLSISVQDDLSSYLRFEALLIFTKELFI